MALTALKAGEELKEDHPIFKIDLFKDVWPELKDL
jgi:hypothetical protein